MRLVDRLFFATVAVSFLVEANAAVEGCTPQNVDLGAVEIGFTSTLDNDVGPNGYLDVELVYAGQGWVAWGFSESGDMAPGFAVVGIPGGNPEVAVYSMTSKSPDGVQPLDSSKQTLQNAKLTQNATHTIMSFSKRLVEDSEMAIDGKGANKFIAAWGSGSSFGYHGGTNRQRVGLTLEACVKSNPVSPPTTLPVPTAAPNNQGITEAPTAVPILPGPPTDAPSEALTTGAPTAAPAPPTPPPIATATVVPSAAPILAPSPAASPTGGASKSTKIVGDCTQLQQKIKPGPLRVGFTSTLDNDVGPNGYLQVQVVYPGQAWLAWGYSRLGGMVPGYGVIGVAGDEPRKISMTDKSPAGVQKLDKAYQTLKDATFQQNGTHSILTFKKRLIEDQELAIEGEGSNIFLFAWGANNTFGYHGGSNRMAFKYNLRACVPPAPTNSPTTPELSPPSKAPTDNEPTMAPAPVSTGTSNKIIGDCSKLQQMIKLKHLNVGFTSTLDKGVGPNGYLKVQITYPGRGWVAWGYSSSGGMVPGHAVLGIPDFAPTKVYMANKTVTGVVPLEDSYQTLNDAVMHQNETVTVLTFTKRLIEENEQGINGGGSNAFLLAWGTNSTFGYHGPSNSLAFVYTLKQCVNGTKPAKAPVKAPTVIDAPTDAPAPVANLSPNKIVGDCSEPQQIVNLGPVQAMFTASLDNDVGPNGYLNAEIVYKGIGWLAWGYSATGAMIPGFAVVGVPGYAPTEVKMSGKTIEQMEGLPQYQQTVMNQRIMQNGTHTILMFTKRLIEEQKLTINGDGENKFLLAWGKDNTYGYHDPSNRLSFSLTLRPCVNGEPSGSSATQTISLAGPSNHQQLWGAHGFFAAVAWGILAPFAIGASLLRRVFIQSDLPALWFKIHQTVNMMVFIFTTFAFSFAVRAISLSEGVRHFRDVQHRTTGLAIVLLVFGQAMSGLLRPHTPNPPKTLDDDDEEHAPMEPEHHNVADSQKSVSRIRWEIGHRLVGFGVQIFAWWQVQNGLKLYASYYDEKDLSNVFWGITGSLIGITFIAYVVHFRYY